MAAVWLSKPLISGSVTISEAIDPSSATQRTARALSSRPSANSRTPTAMGSQMAALSSPNSAPPERRQRRRQARPDAPGQQRDHTEQHDQRVPVHVPGLQQAHDAREAAHRGGGSVDGQAIDDAEVTALPEHA